MCDFVGAYRILRECGRGSYGVVYLAESTVSGRRVALKILNGRQEARELEGLIRYRECRHANLLQLHHIDRLPDGRLYYTMDAADDCGKDGVYRPDTLAARGRIDAAELLPMLRALLDGVAALHRRKLIHRDIKPENILFVDKIPVLGDIGLVAPSGDASMVGTPSFLPPDVLAGARAPDAASDLYALGRVAYVALTGLPPHKYPQIPKNLPREAAPVLAFCRAANAGDATLGSCRTALDAPPRRNIRPLWPAVAVLLLAVITAVAVSLLRPRPVPAGPSVPPSDRHPRTDTEIDAELKQSGTELARKMRQLDAKVAASQARMRRMMRKLSPEEYRAAVENLKRRYPLPDELRQRANARYETVRKEYFEASKTLSPFTAEGAAAIARLDEDHRRLEETDLLYKIGNLTDSIEFTARTGYASGTAAVLETIEAMYQERQTAIRQLENSAK